MDWKGKRFLVFGAGISGAAACELLIHRQMDVILYDGNKALDKEALLAEHPLLANAAIYTGELPKEAISQTDLVVLSPGVPTDLPLVEEIRSRGIEIWGEIELAYVFGRGRVLAVTGTNGKTTTTALLGEILKQAYADVRVVGNIGLPYTSVALDTTEETVIAAELSSFQLETVHRFCPQVSAILNITPDHLNRHHTMERYIEAKKAIVAGQSADAACVLNYEDPVLREFGANIKPKVVYFSSARPLKQGMYLQGETIWYASGQTREKLCEIGELKLLGVHNYENVMAASAMALSFGVSVEQIRAALLVFEGVAHRIEYVGSKRGIRFYNDSKGTNPDAAIQAIRAMKWPTLLIGGGYDKGSSYEEWIRAFDGKVKKLVLLGATREKIAAAAEACGFAKEKLVFADSLKEAVSVCYQNAKEGDAILLSPACASWGMFRNFEERGNLFKEIVKELEE